MGISDQVDPLATTCNEIILAKVKLERKPFYNLRPVFFFCLLVLPFFSDAFAQNSPQIRRLPPSLERELKLRRGGKTRIVGFIDTLKAQNLIAQSIRDSSVEELDSTTVRDTAIIVIDSSVSLTDKEWLDSMLAELPEYRMTPEGVRFQYPAEILVETTRKVVPQDTTLPSKMDPVTKEDLPLYEASPMPVPLSHTTVPNTSIELGAGVPYVPRLDVSSLIVSNDKSAVELTGKYRLTGASEPAIKQYWQIGAGGNFLFPNPSIPSGEGMPELDILAATGANKRLVISQIDSTQHILSQTNISADFSVGSPSQLKLLSDARISFLTDDIGGGSSENHGSIDLSLSKNIFSSNRLDLGLRYEAISSLNLVSQSVSPNLIEAKLSLVQKEERPFRWQAGFSFVSGSDAGGSTSLFSPQLGVKWRASHVLEIGASFFPQNKLIGLAELLQKNLFYSPLIPLASSSVDSLFPGDARRIMSEPIHISLFASYFLSLSNEVHAEFRYITRNNESVFDAHLDREHHVIFDATPLKTKRVELEAGLNLQLFTRDIFRASLLFRTASILATGQILPYEPTSQLQANYQFRNLSDKCIPQIEFLFLTRTGHSYAFLNIEIPYSFSKQFALKLRAENILGSTGDFWNGYDEYPRAVWVSAEYRF